MFPGAGAAAGAAGGIYFDLERATVFEVDPEGTLHIESDGRFFALEPTDEQVAVMPPIASPELWSWWTASTFCCGMGALTLFVSSVAREGGLSRLGQILTLVGVAVAATVMIATSLLIWRRGRESRPEREAAVSAVRTLTGLRVSQRQARRFLSSTTDYLVAADGTAWAVHDGVIYRGGRTDRRRSLPRFSG